MLGVLVMGVLLAMVPQTMQLPINHPLHNAVSKINDVTSRPYIGLILSSESDENLLLDSGSFVPNRQTPSLNIAGRIFNFGEFNGVPTIYVLAFPPLAHVGVTIQILLDNFLIEGIIDYGKAATVSKSVKLGDVAVISKTAYISPLKWKENNEDSEDSSKDLPLLKVGDYNLPEAGDNELGSFQFKKVRKYTPKGINKKTFWYYTDPEWRQLASQLKDLSLESCNGRLCSKDKPSVVFGVQASSSDAYLQNTAYGEFLNKELHVSTVDRKSAATVSTAVANGVKHIVFQAASNTPGESKDKELSELAGKNNLKVVSAFIELIARQQSSTFAKQ